MTREIEQRGHQCLTDGSVCGSYSIWERARGGRGCRKVIRARGSVLRGRPAGRECRRGDRVEGLNIGEGGDLGRGDSGNEQSKDQPENQAVGRGYFHVVATRNSMELRIV